MQTLGGDFDFFKEFAQDSREVITGLQQKTGTLVVDESPPFEAVKRILQDLQAIKGSAEFLGVEAIYKVIKTLVDFFNGIQDNKEKLAESDAQMISRALDRVMIVIDDLESGKSVAVVDAQVNDILEQVTGSKHYHPEPEFNEDFQITITSEMMSTYTSEADEQLEAAEESLLGLEKNLADRELLDTAFRAIHTFKGNSGLFGFGQLEKLGHSFESIMEDFKSGQITVDQKGITVLLRVLDTLKAAIGELPDGNGKVADFQDYMKMMHDYQNKGHVVKVVGRSNATMLGEILIEMDVLERETLEIALSRQSLSVGEILREMDAISPSHLEQALEIQRQRREIQPEENQQRRAASQNIRVDLFKLDALINLVGELIVAENMVSHNPDLDGYHFENFRKAAHNLNRISRDLQDISMSLRMLPITGTFHKMVRVVRDVSQKQGKIVELLLSGEDTEVDKNVAEKISGPLLHIIRNAIDHGIETPQVRENAGKNPQGRIYLRAFHDGGEVVIEIEDDGAGINLDKIVAKAREKHLIDQYTEFANEQEIFNLLFEPGFSTAEQVTDISGRGVGMDVVRQNVETIGGRVHIQSRLGKGTLFSIRIPLTLAIIEGMLVRVGDQLFTIPLLSIRETLQARPKALSTTIDGSELVRIRNDLIPILRLHELFHLTPDFLDLPSGILVMVDFGGQPICLFVDEILGQCQTVIKGLSGFFGTVPGVSGTSILRNGDISLILDIQSLAEISIDHDWEHSSLAPPEK